ncbi:hypothetical protein KLP28_11690 [Nocardioidaceae bacterium]|nr:hypothetical protein KLP28_11690 [Nocardioidaceae bacterium]
MATGRRRRVDGVADLTDAVGARLTTAARLDASLRGRARVADRLWWSRVLADLAGGTHSVLEHGYLTLVERPHGLPRGVRQVRRAHHESVTYSDVEYPTWGLRVELDGLSHHRSRRQRDRDLDRDVLASLAGDASLRLGWAHVVERGCWTAGAVARLLRSRGWTGTITSCSSTCTVAGHLAA